MNNNLKYFKGKACTIYTCPVTRYFDEAQHANVFVGLVDEIDDYGLWLIQLAGKNKSFFTFHSLVCIIEETVTAFTTKEEVDQIQKQLEARLPEKNPQQLIQLETLKALKKQNQ